MDSQKIETYILGIKKEIAPATGCTEPAAIALCAAYAAQLLNKPVETVQVNVSEYILKNAMNVGIPGTGVTGLNMAAALGTQHAHPEKKLSVLSGFSPEERERAFELVAQHKVGVQVAPNAPKVFIQVLARNGEEETEAIIADAHDNLTFLRHNKVIVFNKQENAPLQDKQEPVESEYHRTLGEIWEFARCVPGEKLEFLEELIRLNEGIATEGLKHPYGLQVGQNIRHSAVLGFMGEDLTNYAVAATAAAADARMSGCERSVMSVAGSGNQGLTATVPLIALARKTGCSQEKLYRSLALSILVTVHAKRYIGKLSVLCGCSIAAAIGVSAAIVFLRDGSFSQAEKAINTMVADIAGVVCDGAKPGCALKIATAVHSAVLAASMALCGLGASGYDGIVDQDAEHSLKNLGILGNVGMDHTNQTILSMLLEKQLKEETTA